MNKILNCFIISSLALIVGCSEKNVRISDTRNSIENIKLYLSRSYDTTQISEIYYNTELSTNRAKFADVEFSFSTNKAKLFWGDGIRLMYDTYNNVILQEYMSPSENLDYLSTPGWTCSFDSVFLTFEPFLYIDCSILRYQLQNYEFDSESQRLIFAKDQISRRFSGNYFNVQGKMKFVANYSMMPFETAYEIINNEPQDCYTKSVLHYLEKIASDENEKTILCLGNAQRIDIYDFTLLLRSNTVSNIHRFRFNLTGKY